MTISDCPSAAAQAERFLRSDVGRAIVHRTLDANSLSQNLQEDLVQDALARVCSAAARGEVIDNVEAFAIVVLRRAAIDIVRGRVRSPQLVDWAEIVDPDAEGQGWPFDAASPLDVEADALGRRSLADLRAALRPLLALDPAAGAAALAYLAITVDGAAPAPPCPQPDGGATAGERAEWAALHYSGQSRCFPRDDRPGHGGAGSPAAVRKRRSRAAGRMRDLLARAATAAGLEPQGALHG